MTQPPWSPPPVELSYQSVSENQTGQLLVRLGGIFNLVSAGIDLVHALICTVAAGLIIYTLTSAAHLARPMPPPRPGMPVPPPPPPPPSTPEILMMSLVYAIPGALSVLASIPKCIGAIKLLRRKRFAWGWALASGIVGCTEVWMFMPCCVIYIFPLAVGVFTIVMVCLPAAQSWLSSEQRQLFPQ